MEVGGTEYGIVQKVDVVTPLFTQPELMLDREILSGVVVHATARRKIACWADTVFQRRYALHNQV